MVDENLKVLVEAHSAALAGLLAKIASGEPNLAEDISHVSATDADLRSAIAGVPDVVAPEPPAAA